MAHLYSHIGLSSAVSYFLWRGFEHRLVTHYLIFQGLSDPAVEVRTGPTCHKFSCFDEDFSVKHSKTCDWFITSGLIGAESYCLTGMIVYDGRMPTKTPRRRRRSNQTKEQPNTDGNKWSIFCKVDQRPSTLSCSRFSAVIFVCAENVVKNGVDFCIMANLMLYIGTHSIGTCANLLHNIIIIIIIIIINPKETLNETLKKPSNKS